MTLVLQVRKVLLVIQDLQDLPVHKVQLEPQAQLVLPVLKV